MKLLLLESCDDPFREDRTYIVVDAENRVEYWYICPYGFAPSLTPRLGTDGKPLLYSGDLASLEND